MKLTYRQAYGRIVDAYMQDKLEPYCDCACFVGNLLGGTATWAYQREMSWAGYGNLLQEEDCEFYVATFNSAVSLINNYGYTREQILKLEKNFLASLTAFTQNREEKENQIFNAMSSTLDMLKKIHEENGEIVDAPIFKKRQLQSA